MKTMSFKVGKKIQNCLKNEQLSLYFRTILAALLLVTVQGMATEVTRTSRKPAAVEEEVLTVPLVENTFSNENLFPEDDAGVLKNMRESLYGWEKKEEYVHQWGLESTGLYVTPSTAEKRKFISSKLLRYADKRLSGEMQKADQGSTLYRIGKVEKNLRPNASVPLNKFISLKFKARVLQGKAIVEVKNPWIELNSTVSVNGKARVISRKEFKQLGLTSGAEYTLNDSQFLAYMDQQITSNVKARISSTQTGGTNVFSNNADAVIQMVASFPFNF